MENFTLEFVENPTLNSVLIWGMISCGFFAFSAMILNSFLPEKMGIKKKITVKICLFLMLVSVMATLVTTAMLNYFS